MATYLSELMLNGQYFLQVFIYYGARSSIDFLLYSGFVPTNNNADSVKLLMGISSADPLFASKSKILNQLDIPMYVFAIGGYVYFYCV